MDTRDPETKEFRAARYEAAVAEFQEVAGRNPAFGRALFRIRLIALGFVPGEIASEIVMHAPRWIPSGNLLTMGRV